MCAKFARLLLAEKFMDDRWRSSRKLFSGALGFVGVEFFRHVGGGLWLEYQINAKMMR
jgi:hypothetical protein